MVLDPLTEVVIGVLVAVRIGNGELVMHVLRDRKGGKPEEDTDYPYSYSYTEQTEKAYGLYRQGHHDVRIRYLSNLQAALTIHKNTPPLASLSTGMDFSPAIR
jgi:hypothetical protein